MTDRELRRLPVPDLTEAKKLLLKRGQAGDIPALRLLKTIYGLRLPLVEARLNISLDTLQHSTHHWGDPWWCREGER